MVQLKPESSIPPDVVIRQRADPVLPLRHPTLARQDRVAELDPAHVGPTRNVLLEPDDVPKGEGRVNQTQSAQSTR